MTITHQGVTVTVWTDHELACYLALAEPWEGGMAERRTCDRCGHPMSARSIEAVIAHAEAHEAVCPGYPVQ